MAEWSNAAVLKTVDCNRSGGSNPSFSAKENPQLMLWVFYFLRCMVISFTISIKFNLLLALLISYNKNHTMLPWKVTYIFFEFKASSLHFFDSLFFRHFMYFFNRNTRVFTSVFN